MKKWLLAAAAAAAVGVTSVVGYSIFSSSSSSPLAQQREQQISTIWQTPKTDEKKPSQPQQPPGQLPLQIPSQQLPAGQLPTAMNPAALPQQPVRQPTMPTTPPAFIPPPSLPATGSWQVQQFAASQSAWQAQQAQQKAEEDARRSKIMVYSADAGQAKATASQAVETTGRVLLAGTVIPAVLMQAISSDAPGVVVAMVTQDVYDSSTGNFVLIPAGSRLVGKYDTDLAYAQERLKIDFERIILPDGRQVNLAGYGADAAGAAGFRDRVDHHTNRTVNAAILSAIVSAATAAATGQAGDAAQAAAAGAVDAITNTMSKIIEKNLNVKPTITVRAGYRLNAVLAKDITI
ncbi:TrbI/VirB10 family protein [Sporolituus thermophilus]|uniref:TrbI/VirB10 family protein n=1 Tax=Sporolituus thermophilus TaxID=608505 RepID=UPI001495B44C|nr:TrbI/VirB10 family protein [Sporolituus thermophilus]